MAKENIDNLMNYIENNEVVYQICDGLIEVSKECNSDNRKSLLENFKHMTSIEVYQKGASYIHDSFEELESWATKDDLLFLLKIPGILICIPKKDAIDNCLITD